MSSITFTPGAEYPNLKGTVTWAGSVKTDTITGIMLSNGINTGPFSGDLVAEDYVSENPTESTWSWSYDVEVTDTVAGVYEISLRLIHDSGEIEFVVPFNRTIRVD